MDMTKRSRSEWQSIRKAYLESIQRTRDLRLQLRNRVWAVTDDGAWVALPGVTATSNPDLWWLTIRRDDYRERRALGAILLCASADEPLRDFGLPADLLAEIEPHLSLGTERPLLHFTVIRSRSRFELQLKRSRALDITDRLGDVSWIAGSGRRPSPRTAAPVASPTADHSLTAEAAPGYGAAPDSGPEPGELRFFARASDAGLEPVDPVGLQRGAVYLVRAARTAGAPRSTALRRILARGGPEDLPRDLSAQHDHYAHGGPKR